MSKLSADSQWYLIGAHYTHLYLVILTTTLSVHLVSMDCGLALLKLMMTILIA